MVVSLWLGLLSPTTGYEHNFWRRDQAEPGEFDLKTKGILWQINKITTERAENQ
jgi:hypothetical protein